MCCTPLPAQCTHMDVERVVALQHRLPLQALWRQGKCVMDLSNGLPQLCCPSSHLHASVAQELMSSMQDDPAAYRMMRIAHAQGRHVLEISRTSARLNSPSPAPSSMWLISGYCLELERGTTMLRLSNV